MVQALQLANAEFSVCAGTRIGGEEPVTSNFFRNMQFIAFYDIGTSWTGAPPTSTENSLRTEQI